MAIVILFSARFLIDCRLKTFYLIWWADLLGFALIWKWTSPFTGMFRDGESMLARFYVIRNFLANETDHFPRLSHLPGQPAPYNQLLIQPPLFGSRMLSCIKCWIQVFEVLSFKIYQNVVFIKQHFVSCCGYLFEFIFAPYWRFNICVI